MGAAGNNRYSITLGKCFYVKQNKKKKKELNYALGELHKNELTLQSKCIFNEKNRCYDSQ